MTLSLEAQIEAILFFKAVPVKKSELAKALDVPLQNINGALKLLEEKLASSGLQLVQKDSEILLTTSKEMSPIIEKIQHEDLKKELSKAALETLSIILYHGPVTRSDIDYIRGVNSTYMLRTLLIRGLVERIVNPLDKRGHIYKPTFDLLQYLGVSRTSELPDYENVHKKLKTFAHQAEDQKSHDS